MGLGAGLMIALLWHSSATVQQTPDYMGARAVLARMGVAPTGSALLDPKAVFADDLVAFGEKLGALPPQAAALGWLDLVHRCFALTDAEREDYRSGQISEVVKALPSPDSWPFIEHLLDGSSEQPVRKLSLMLLLDILQAEYKTAEKHLASIEEELRDANEADSIESIRLELAIRRHDADAIESVLTKKADRLQETPRIYSDFSGPSMGIPDLVALLGERRAEKLVTHILLTAKTELVVGDYRAHTTATEDLARKLALRLADRVAWPQWSLASSPEAGTVFQSFAKRFPKVKLGITNSNPPSGSTLDVAATYCFVNLFVAGRTEEAKAFGAARNYALGFGWMMSPDPELVDHLVRTAKLRPLLRLLSELADKHPDTGLPQFYMALAADNETLASSELFLKRILASPGEHYQKDWAIGELRTLYLREGKLLEYLSLLSNPLRELPEGFDAGTGAERLIAVAGQLHRPDLLKRGLARAMTSFTGFGYSIDGELLTTLIAHGSGVQVEQTLIKALRDAVSAKSGGSPPPAQQEARALAEFYFQVGRYRDVVTLLEKFSGWGVPDLTGMATSGDDVSFLYMAAKSLSKVGRNEEAIRILRHDLRIRPDDDADYRLLLDIDPIHSGETIDALVREFPAESRPLIWKAVRLQRARQLTIAGSMIHRAIQLDPDDLDKWGKPSRFKAYEVLSGIEKARHQPSEAARLDSYAAGARMASKAFEFDLIGLSQEAIDLYKKEVTSLPNDFRSRVELGIEEMHYGRVPEGLHQIAEAFRRVPPKYSESYRYAYHYQLGPQARALASKALAAQIKTGTHNPDVYAFLGEFENADGHSLPAIQLFEKALQLDPDCLFAAEGLSELHTLLPLRLNQRVNSALIRLGSRDYRFEQAEIIDYASYWRAAANSVKRRLESSNLIFNLPASRAELGRTSNSNYVEDREREPWEQGLGPPADSLAQDSLISQICSLIDRPQGRIGR